MRRVISSVHSLMTVVQTVRRILHTTLNNICTVLILSGIELGTLKSLNIQNVMLTFPMYHRGTKKNIYVHFHVTLNERYVYKT
jgi:hypothetical protein